jgi:hypothetical protein
MKVKCLGKQYKLSNVICDTGLDLDKIHIVYGIEKQIDKTLYFVYTGEHITYIPDYMFEIMDDKPSKFWLEKKWVSGSITLWPELFYKEYFFEDFGEYDDVLRKEFEIVLENFEKESND